MTSWQLAISIQRFTNQRFNWPLIWLQRLATASIEYCWRLWQIFSVLLLSSALQACSKVDDAAAKPEGTPVSISGYNYTNEGIQEFFVNAGWGGGLGIGEGGGMVCCIALPDKWTPGLTATVEWRRSDCGGSGPGNERCPIGKRPWAPPKTIKTTVPIEPYDRPNGAQVMFLPNDEVKIYVAPVYPEHPDHPAKLGRPHPIGHPEWKP